MSAKENTLQWLFALRALQPPQLAMRLRAQLLLQEPQGLG